MKNKIYFCIAAYNEEKNLETLLSRLLKEPLLGYQSQVVVYTDAPTDTTADIVSTMASLNPRVLHLSGTVRQGKVAALRSIKNVLKEKDDAAWWIFIDADTMPEEGAISILISCGDRHQYKAVSPLFQAVVEGDFFHRVRLTFGNKIFSNNTIHKNKPYISGRLYAIRPESLPDIPLNSFFDDLYINLLLPVESIGMCAESRVLFRAPGGMADFIRYAVRKGVASKNLKRNYPELFALQESRYGMWEQCFFRTTRKNFRHFFVQLSFFERVAFCMENIILALCFAYGFYLQNPAQTFWKPLLTTKKAIAS